MQKKNHIGKIEAIQQINKQVYSIEFSSPTLKSINPGQYISILCEGLTLRRPFSVADFDNGVLKVLFKQKGKGTEYISGLKVGDNIEFSAPLGNTFTIDDKKTLLIGAGIGVAPLFYLSKKLREKGVDTFFAAGFLSKEDILGEFDFVSTDDGSFGFKGSICDYLETLIKDFAPDRIVSCAPNAVLRVISEVAKSHKIDCEIAMEKVMACGIGICRGCVIEVRRDGKVQNATVCKDGPVFKGEEVVW